MSTSPDDPGSMLTIGDLAERTGVTPATLRIWEQRHGFPEPLRRASGHRRYAETEVDTVRSVVAQRDSGVRLDVAISRAIDQAKRTARPGSGSVYADIRRRHPKMAVHRLRKSTLLAMSWAIEDECSATAQRAHVFGAFQYYKHYASAEERWGELARISQSTFAFASFTPEEIERAPEAGPTLVPLAEDAPMQREWAVVLDGDRLAVVLTAWELPGQYDVPDRERLFEAVWTVDPDVVRDAARVCLQVARGAGAKVSDEVIHDLGADPLPGGADPMIAMNLFNRVVAYTDRIGRP